MLLARSQGNIHKFDYVSKRVYRKMCKSSVDSIILFVFVLSYKEGHWTNKFVRGSKPISTIKGEGMGREMKS